MCMVMGGFRKTFQECLKRFTKQRLDLLIPSIDIRLDNLEDTLENSIRPVFSKNCASACWMIDIIIDSFIRVAFKYGSYNEPSFISEVQRHVTKQIQDELRSLTHGLDFDLITQLSMENYESQTGEGLTIALVPYAYPISDIGRLGHVLLFDPAQYCHLNNESIHAIRKQLNMTKGNCLLLGCGTSGGIMDFFSFGVGKASLLSYFPSIALLGHSKWSFQLPRKHDKHSLPECKIRYEGGRFMLPLVRTNSLERMILYNKLKDSCHHNRAFRPDLKILNKVISLAKSQKKGTILILTDQEGAKLECERLCQEFNRGTFFPKPLSVSSPGEKDILKQLTAIDGAIILDLEGSCWACGVILDGEACIRGEMARGARYNSTKNYIKSVHSKYPDNPFAAIVASEDGMVDFFP